ncbi:MAG: PAS domain S-box protein [Cyanobacteria bacterium SZAS TMP-1]|nr:PAS domain S-box protein [Cyanobacteria bacterium SZAS TMP-1]
MKKSQQFRASTPGPRLFFRFEDHFQHLSNALPLSIIHTDANGNATYANQKWEQLSGLNSDESLGSSWQTKVHPDDLPDLLECRRKAIELDEPYSAAVRLSTTDGSIVWLSATVTPLGISEGENYGLVWTFEDISSRVLAEQNMRTQLEVTRTISEAASLDDAAPQILSAICLNTAWQGGVFWDLRSSEYEALPFAYLSTDKRLNCELLVSELSKTYDDLIIKQTLRLQSPVSSVTSAEDDSDRHQVLVNYGVLCRLILPIVTRRQVQGIIELFGTTLTTNTPESLRMLQGLANQIAEFGDRVATEAELRESDAKIRAMVTFAVDGIITVDTAGIVESINPAFERMFGYEPFKIVGNSASLLLPEDQTLKKFLAFLESSPESPVDRLLKTRNGSLLDVEMSVSKTGGEKTLFYTIILRDISVRKEVERRLREFYSTVSHELRTPLTSIRGALGLIEGGVLGEIPEEVLEVISISRSNSDRLIRLVNDILDLQKIEADKLELRLTMIDAFELVEKTLAEIKGFADERSISVTRDASFACPLKVDRDRIIQVLTNLLSNAIKFSEPGKSVQVKLSRTEENRARFSVIDQGPGIAPENVPKLFGKFQQLDSSDTRAQDGTGLGLAISKAIVERHGGDIGIESVLGEGSTFWFELKLVEQL